MDVAGTTGDVMRIGLRSTWVRGNDNAVVIVPNSDFVTGRVLNWTGLDTVKVGVSYDSDPEEVRDLLDGAALVHPDVIETPAPEAVLSGFGESAINFELRVWTTRQVKTPGRLMSDLHLAILRTFREKGVEIPYPHRAVHVRSISGPIPAEGAV